MNQGSRIWYDKQLKSKEITDIIPTQQYGKSGRFDFATDSSNRIFLALKMEDLKNFRFGTITNQ